MPMDLPGLVFICSILIKLPRGGGKKKSQDVSARFMALVFTLGSEKNVLPPLMLSGKGEGFQGVWDCDFEICPTRRGLPIRTLQGFLVLQLLLNTLGFG